MSERAYETIGWRNLWVPPTSHWHLFWGEEPPCIVGDWEPIYREVPAKAAPQSKTPAHSGKGASGQT
jgi:hypothetical protein